MLTRVWQRLRDFFINKVLGVHDTPHRIALGVAIGIFITWMPLIGAQMVLIVFFSILLRANKVVGAPFAWITNPATLWLYIPNYFLGCVVLGMEYDGKKLMDGLMVVFEPTTRGLGDRFSQLGTMLWDLAAPLFVGSAIVGGVLAFFTYFIIYRAVVQYRRFRHEDIMTGYPVGKAHAPETAEPPPPPAESDTQAGSELQNVK